MGLDIYVIPLWRFLAKDFEFRAEHDGQRLGVPSATVTPDGIIPRPQPPVDDYRVAMFKRKARNIAERVEEFNRPAKIQWNDEGECIYGERCVDYGMKSLRAYALWLCRVDNSTEFARPPENDFYKHSVWAARKSKEIRFPHLIDHDCYMSYYLPCEFKNVTRVEKVLLGGFLKAHVLAASSLRLREELIEVGASLMSNLGLNLLHEAQIRNIREAFEQMSTVADLSCQHGLPIAFWG